MAAMGLGFLGLVTGLYHPAGLKMVSHSPNVSRNMSYHGVAGSLGLAAGPIYGGWMASWLGWRIAYLLPGGLALLGLIIILAYHHESVPSQCSDDEGYRVLSIPNSSNEIIINDCYNSCYDCND